MDEVKSIRNGELLTIEMKGHVDSNNAAQTEAAILPLLSDPEIREVTIDGAKLDYISSAGLRVLLKMRKANNKISFINVSSEIFEILEMTGFTEMIHVEKAYREVSVDGCEVIGHGANGTLYRIDQDNVVKVYKNADALEDIKNEREMAKTALVLGIPTAIPYDVVKVNDSFGSVFELLNASSFAEILRNKPEKTDWCVREFTDMLNRIHGTLVPHGKLSDIRVTALGWAEFMKDHLPREAYEKLLRLVGEIPQDDHMIHGDYHIKNLELQNDEILLIDMDTLAVGNPIFEIASMYNAFVGYGEYDNERISEFLGISYEASKDFLHKVLVCYLATDDEEEISEVLDKARIIGYTRMIRREIRRGGLEDEERKKSIDLWEQELLELLGRVDSLQFIRNVLTVDAKKENLDDIMKFVDKHLEMLGCDPVNQIRIETAVEEIYVNIASYAYPNAVGQAAIYAKALKDPRGIEICFRDQGVPFDPLAREDPDVTLKAEDRNIGGLGIYMVKNSMDQVSYEYCDGKNVLKFRKFF